MTSFAALSAHAGAWTLAEEFSRELPYVTPGEELPRQVQMDDELLYLAYVGGGSGGQFVEYLPAGQSLEQWDRMLSVYHHVSQAPDQLLEARRAMAGESLQMLYSPPERHEYIVAHPLKQHDFEEHMVIHLREIGKGSIATVLAHRTYQMREEFVEQFRSRMVANTYRWQLELRNLPVITPPVLGSHGESMIFTRKGRESGEVWVGTAQP